MIIPSFLSLLGKLRIWSYEEFVITILRFVSTSCKIVLSYYEEVVAFQALLVNV